MGISFAWGELFERYIREPASGITTPFTGEWFHLQMVSLERRKHGRDSLTLIVLRVGERNARYFFGYASNIGPGGMFFPSVNPKQSGEQFSILFKLPGKERSETWAACRCEVVRRHEYDPSSGQRAGFGVKFLDLSEDVGKAIEMWVERRYS